ncbi:MAG: TetR/AcrR family transcriptional regulator [Streptomycetaceae bacterium]|nr:TetR/AcrR family transcriptional regulator [Streptomycetaceae bacterium]
MTGPARGGEQETRTALLEATIRLMLRDGYAGVSTRKVAAEAGVNPALVYYYFRTMDELFLAVFRRGAEANLRRMRRALDAERPLRAVWEVSSEPVNTALILEFLALANHRDSVRTELAAYSARFRAMQAQAVEQALKDTGVDRGEFPPAAMTVLISGLSRILVMDDVIGLTEGHAEMRALIEKFLARLDAPETEPPPAD